MNWILVILIISTSAIGQTSYVPPTKLLGKKGYQIGISGDTWRTSKTVDKDGKKTSLAEGSSFDRFQGEASGYYGAAKELQFGLGLRYRQNRSISEVSGESQTATSTGIESTFASIKYAFDPVDKIQYTLEGLFRFIPYTNQEFVAAEDDAQILSLGDEGSQISLGLGATYNINNHIFFTGRGGYRKAGTHLSDELYWQFEAAKAWTSVALVAGVDGITSMNNDPYGEDQTQRPFFNYGNTALYNQENRELVAPYVGANFAFGKSWRIELRGSQVVAGQSTDLGTALSFALVRREDKGGSRLIDSRFKAYDLEASITKVSPEKNYVVIDKGLADDVFKGMKFDFFEFDYVGGNILVASGVVVQAKSDTAIVKITQKFNAKKELKDGLVGRANLK